MLNLPFWIAVIVIAAYFITILSVVGVMLSENRNPIRSLTWVIALIFLPIIGLVFYIFFGRSLKGRHLISQQNKRKLFSRMTPPKADIQEDHDLSDNDRSIIKLARSVSGAHFTLNNRIRVFTTGKQKFASLRTALRQAEKSIYLQYYIFSDDKLGHEISDILIEKARQGVEVYVIYDHVGSFSAHNKFFKRMEEAGVKTHPFFKVTFPQFANRINWRNHRKLVVIDSKIGYIGGMNIADRYESGSETGLPWRDTHFRVEGDIVTSMISSFMMDWNFNNDNPIRNIPEVPPNPIRSLTGMQLVTSGPTGNWDNLALCFLKAIASASKLIYIQTPYFLPTDALVHALEAASMAKVDVRIMIPRKNDSKLLQYASFSNVTLCLKAGIKVYLYEEAMLHAKAMIIDDNIVTAGSTNFDFRSFENNFECSLLIYDRDLSEHMRDIFFSDMEKCTKLTYSKWHKRPLLQRTLESILRLISPIL